MKVEKIKKLASGKYKIELDDKNKIITYDDVILKHHLLFDKNINSSTLDNISADTAYYEAYNKTINYIYTKMRSLKEINTYLNKFSLTDKEKKEIITNLINLNLINDELFAKAYTNDKINLSNSGPNKIKAELKEHDIDDAIIESALNTVDNELLTEKLSSIIAKKIRLNHKHSNYMLRQKLLVELTNSGFSKEMISQLFEELKNNNPDILEKTYTKVYNDLAKKYHDRELLVKIKQKLYAKGFNQGEINEFLAQKFDQ